MYFLIDWKIYDNLLKLSVEGPIDYCIKLERLIFKKMVILSSCDEDCLYANVDGIVTNIQNCTIINIYKNNIKSPKNSLNLEKFQIFIFYISICCTLCETLE